MSELAVGSLAGLAANSYVIDVASGSQLTQPGMVLQVVSTTKTDTFSASLSSGTFSSNITGLEATITRLSSSSKMIVQVTLVGQQEDFTAINYRVLRDSTPIGVGDAASSRSQLSVGSEGPSSLTDRVQSAGFIFLDSPATTSAITYGVQVFNRSGVTRTLYVNRSQSDTDSATVGRYVSTITLMEIAG
jgi:hypothetical protein